MADAGQTVLGYVESARKLRIGRRRFYRWRVPGAFLVGAATLILARPTLTSFLLGLALVLPGEVLRLWASGHIEKTSRLATGGPYGHTQHPLYLGSLMIALGVAVAAARPAAFLAVGAYVLAFFPFVIRDEREFLRKRFGPEYERWTAEVPSFLPRLLPAGPRSTRFTWRRVISNHEWRVCLAPPAALALLYLQELLAP
jgi:phospholipid methyltransferase